MSGSNTDALLSLTSQAGTGLIPIRLLATETISTLFRFEIDAVSADTIDALSVLNTPACIAVNHAGAATRYFHGIVAEFGAMGRNGTLDTLYRMVLVPQLAQTSLQEDCRLFFKKTAEDIVKAIFTDAGVTDTAFRLYSSPAQRDATAQYNETSLHFVTRLLEEEGWYYFFEHTSDKHTLVITNANNGFTAFPDANASFGDGVTANTLTSFVAPHPITHGAISLRDYDPDVTTKQLKATQNTVLGHGGVANRAVFRWPALTRETAMVADRAKWRMEAAEAAASLVSSTSAMACLVAGGRFKLKDTDGAETQYVVHSIRHFAEDDARRAGSGNASYSNNFAAFANTVPWRQPMATARPRMEGLHTAIVLAPAGEEIHTDDQGRVKICFFWDWRADATADNSAWVRVVQPWGGNKWGGQFIPRVDTEVAVAFMDADPDRPVVVGGFYNGTDKPIYPVAEKTKSGFRTRSVTKGGTADFNELTFDDKKGSELIFTHAQKDMTTEVENDQKLSVDNDRIVTVKGEETVTIKADRTHEITQGNDTLTVKQGNYSTTVSLGNITVKADAGTITLQAAQSITLKVGANTLTLSQSGIEIKGLQVAIEGQTQAELKGLTTSVNGTATLTLKGGVTMIN